MDRLQGLAAIDLRLCASRERVRAAGELGEELPFAAKDLATVVLALSNGLAIEHLPDPDDVPAELLGDVLARLLGR